MLFPPLSDDQQPLADQSVGGPTTNLTQAFKPGELWRYVRQVKGLLGVNDTYNPPLSDPDTRLRKASNVVRNAVRQGLVENDLPEQTGFPVGMLVKIYDGALARMLAMGGDVAAKAEQLQAAQGQDFRM